jgi:hypothetical protein
MSLGVGRCLCVDDVRRRFKIGVSSILETRWKGFFMCGIVAER